MAHALGFASPVTSCELRTTSPIAAAERAAFRRIQPQRDGGDHLLFCIALAQVAPCLGDVEANFAPREERIRAARGQRADVVVFPELSLTGYFLNSGTTIAVSIHNAGAKDKDLRASAPRRGRKPDV